MLIIQIAVGVALGVLLLGALAAVMIGIGITIEQLQEKATPQPKKESRYQMSRRIRREVAERQKEERSRKHERFQV